MYITIINRVWKQNETELFLKNISRMQGFIEHISSHIIISLQ